MLAYYFNYLQEVVFVDPNQTSSVAERLRRRLCNQKIAGSNPASGHLATPFRKEI